MLSQEQIEKEILEFLKSKGGKAPLAIIQKNISWKVDGREMVFDVLNDMERRGLIIIGKNEFGIIMAYSKW